MVCQHREWVQISEPEFVILPEPGIEIEELCIDCRESRRRILSQEEPEQCPHEWQDITCIQDNEKIFRCSKCDIRADTLGKHYPHGVRMLENHLDRVKNLIEIIRLQAQYPITSGMGHPNLEQLTWDMVTDLDNVMLEMRAILERFKRARIPHELLSQNPEYNRGIGG